MSDLVICSTVPGRVSGTNGSNSRRQFVPGRSQWSVQVMDKPIKQGDEYCRLEYQTRTKMSNIEVECSFRRSSHRVVIFWHNLSARPQLSSERIEGKRHNQWGRGLTDHGVGKIHWTFPEPSGVGRAL